MLDRNINWRANPVGFIDAANVVEELRCGRSAGLEVPGFVKGRMMACLDNPIIQVDVSDVSIGSGIADEDSRIVMAVQFGGSFACSFDADPGTEDLQMAKVGLTPVPSFKWGPSGATNNKVVMEVYRMEEGRGPVFRVQGRAI